VDFPLGGIGTGKLEIDNKVKLVNVTISNFITSLIALREITKLMGDSEMVKLEEEKIKEARESYKKIF